MPDRERSFEPVRNAGVDDPLAVPEPYDDALVPLVQTPVTDSISLVDSSTGQEVLNWRAGNTPYTEPQLTTPLGDTDLAGNVILQGGYLKSANYSLGSAGWAIDYAGNAEFNNITVRGLIKGATIRASDGANLITNPDAASAITGWTAITNCVMSRVTGKSWLNTYVAASAVTGIRATSSASGTMVFDSESVTVKAGFAYGVEGAEQSLLGTSTAYTCVIRWFDSGGSLISSSAVETSVFEGSSSEYIVIGPGRSAPLIAPDTAVTAKLRVTAAGATAASQTADFAGMAIYSYGSLGGSSLTVGDYAGGALFSVTGAEGMGKFTALTRNIILGDAQTVGTIYLVGHISTSSGTDWASKPTSFASAAGDWTATTTNPTGRSVSCQYARLGRRTWADIILDFPGAMTAGTGQYIYSGILATYPIDSSVHGPSASIGTWSASGAGTLYGGVARRSATTACRMTVSSGGSVGAASPFVPVSGDTYWISLCYFSSV